jgi:hypothetical protein
VILLFDFLIMVVILSHEGVKNPRPAGGRPFSCPFAALSASAQGDISVWKTLNQFDDK